LKPALHTTLWVELKINDLKAIRPFRIFLGLEQRNPDIKTEPEKVWLNR
jgi:hypothetical protein